MRHTQKKYTKGVSRLLMLITIMMAGLMLASCAQTTKNQQPIIPLSEVSVGVVGAVQPMGTSDLLAGYIPPNRELASKKALIDVDTMMMQSLKASSNPSRTFRFIPAGSGVNPSEARSAGRSTALKHWIEVGKTAGVQLLIVPQILTWHEREGSGAGVVSSAEVDMNFFLIDVDEGLLLARSHYAEKQEGLANNVLKVGDFIKRGGKWVPTLELAQEAVQKMVKEFGL